MYRGNGLVWVICIIGFIGLVVCWIKMYMLPF